MELVHQLQYVGQPNVGQTNAGQTNIYRFSCSSQVYFYMECTIFSTLISRSFTDVIILHESPSRMKPDDIIWLNFSYRKYYLFKSTKLYLLYMIIEEKDIRKYIIGRDRRKQKKVHGSP